jgi:DNA-binding MarR family transcriptional regulator
VSLRARALAILAASPGLTGRSIAARLDADRASVLATLNKARLDGIVSRERVRHVYRWSVVGGAA